MSEPSTNPLPHGFEAHPPPPRKNAKPFRPVFWLAAALIVGLVGAAVFSHQTLESFFGVLQDGIADNAGWFFILTVNVILVLVLILAMGRFGAIRIGGPRARPDFSTASYAAMLFAAGMGIGLVFWAVAEPLSHFVKPPWGEAGSVESARLAMVITFFHWGLHPWAVYALVGVALGFASYNRGLPLTIRSAFHPLLGDRIESWPGRLIDVLAILATLFGVATSLGLGVQQINAGVAKLTAVSMNVPTQLLLVGVITALATVSVVLGLDKGIRRLSEANLIAAAVLLAFVLLAGPTVYLLDSLVQNAGQYALEFVRLATWTETYMDSKWQNGWTIFYWAWWISWSPFVGMFIARISYGRTIREMIGMILVLPTGVTFLWLTVFGNTALRFANQDMTLAENGAANPPLALFEMLERLPFSEAFSWLAVGVIVLFFVTSSDSGSLVVDTIAAGGNQHAPVWQRVFWAVLEGVVAGVLLVGGGLIALQTAAITTGLPFAIVLLVMGWGLLKGLRQHRRRPLAAAVPADATTGQLTDPAGKI